MGDSFNSGGGNMNIAQNQAIAIQSNYTQSKHEDIQSLLTLLEKVRQEVSNLPVSEEVRAELLNEVDGAHLQAKKNPPNNEKITDKLKNATSILEEIPKTVMAVVTVGNLLRQGIEWCVKLGC
jgi:hypothetical protein